MSQKHLIGLRCDVCGRAGYISRKNVKQVERKLEFKKFCKWCRKSTKHKEAKLPLKSAPKKQAPKVKPAAPAEKSTKVAKPTKVAKTPKSKEVKK